MLRNFINIAIRKATQNGLYSIINILGLSLGIAAFIFITKFVNNELRIDKFHSNPDRVFRMISDWKWDTFEEVFSNTPTALGTSMAANFDELEYVTRIRPYNGEIKVKIDDQLFLESNSMAVDSNFLKIFNFNMIEGNPETAFSEPQSVVLPQSFAVKYFGSISALSKSININDEEFNVTGVIEDAPKSGHIDYSLLLSINSDKTVEYFEWSWVWSNLVTYIRLKDSADPADLESKLPDLVMNNAGYAIERITGNSVEAFFENGNRIDFRIQPLSEVYYEYGNSIGPVGNRTYVFAFAGIAILILLLASVNYMNLTTAKSIKRAREVGVRKVIGSSRRQLVFQFLIESILFSLLATVIAVLIGEVMYASLADSFGIRWDLSPLSDLNSMFIVLAIAISVGLISGLYPALYLSSFSPAYTIKGINMQGESKSFLRNVLVIFQFIISFGIIIMSFTVNRQIDFLKNRDLGFDQEKLLVVGNLNFLENKDPFKNDVEKLSSVIVSTLSNVVPGKNGNYELFKKVGDQDADYVMLLINTDENFLETFGIGLLEGNNFSESDLTKTEERFTLISDGAVEDFDFEEPIGRQVFALDDGRNLEVSGIIKEFDFMMSTEEYSPTVIRPYTPHGDASEINYLTIKTSSKDIQTTLADIEKLWNEQGTGLPFQYYFYDQIFAQKFQSENRLSGLLSIFSGMAVFIGLLGLVGLVSYSTEQLQKSIGIRKVFGASIPSILLLLTKDFIKLLVIAFAIAIPVANYFVEDWLKEFVYQVEIEVWFFALPGLIILTVAMITIWTQSIRAAQANPVDAIGNE